MNGNNDHDLIQRVLDGTSSRREFDAFQARLRREPEWVGLYRQYALLHHSLYEEFEGGKTAGLAPRRVPRRSPAPVVAAVLAALAAVVVFAFLLLTQDRGTTGANAPRLVKQTPAAAQALFSEDAVWSVSGGPHPDGQRLRLEPGSVVRLQQGQARLDLGAGALAVIEGDSELHFVSPEILRLERGRGWFKVEREGRRLEVATAGLTVVDLGTEFGVLNRPGRPAEVHVFEGKVQVNLASAAKGTPLGAGEAARLADPDTLQRIPVTMPRFPAPGPPFEVVLADRFDSQSDREGLIDRKPQSGPGAWRVAAGTPHLGDGRLEGGDFTAFCKLPAGALSAARPILLATLETAAPTSGEFHTDGWAGLSFYQEAAELLFFGDAFGPEKTWAIDVKQGLPVLLPDRPLEGPRTVTLRYDRTTGVVTLHEGAPPLAPAFVTGTVPKGLDFDEIRVGASAKAVLAVRSLTVRTGANTGGE